MGTETPTSGLVDGARSRANTRSKADRERYLVIDQETLNETIEVLEAIQEMAPRGGSLYSRIIKLCAVFDRAIQANKTRVSIHQVCQESHERTEGYASQRTRLMRQYLAKEDSVMDILEEIRDLLKK